MKALKVKVNKKWEHYGYFSDERAMKKYIAYNLKGVRRWRMRIKEVSGAKIATKPEYEV